MSTRVGFNALLPLLVIGILFVSIFSPWVEASIVYGPDKYLGDWYLGSNNTVCNGSSNHSNSPIANGSKLNGSLPRENDYNANPGIPYYSNQFPVSNKSAFNDYKSLMGQYRPDMHFDNDGNIRLNGIKNHDDAGSSLVFKFLDKYVKKNNFTIDAPHGNYTLYLRNGDGSGKCVKNGTIFYVRLNGKDVFTPLDDSLTDRVLKKNVTVSQNNTLDVFAVGLPGSYMTLWLEDESPDIVVISPGDDSVRNGTILLAGYTTDHNVTGLTVRQSNNSTITTIPVTNGNFSTDLSINAPVRLDLTAIDSTGTPRTTSLCLDGDHLPEKIEAQFGYDPLNPDSDSPLTAVNEANNGVMDGLEMMDSLMPAYMKGLLGCDPLKKDTDGDNLTDYFEVLRMGLITEPLQADTDGNGVSDALEDRDNDGLTNLEEQALGTNPLNADTDKDGVSDGYEVNISHSNPLLNDSDNDGLLDNGEIALGTQPLNPDTDGNGVLDGAETYTSTHKNNVLNASVSITGTGYLADRIAIDRETSPHLTNCSALASPLVGIRFNGSFESANVTIQYDAGNVSDPANLSLYYYNETWGTFIRVPSVVDTVNKTVSGTVNHFSIYAIFYVPTWNAIFSAEMNNGRGNTSASYVDVMFTIDSSGSMSTSDPAGYRKIAARNFVGALLPGDRAGVVTFSGSASLLRPLTNDFNAVNASINMSGAYDGTDIGAGVSAANSQLIGNGNRSHAWMMILLSDGYGSYSNYYTQQAIANNITIYTVGLGRSVDTALLSSIANATGGRYYSVASADQLPQVYRNISEGMNSTDSDGDGLGDTLETTGFRDGAGNWYRTNQYSNDTDNDTIPDGVEAGALLSRASISNGMKALAMTSNDNGGYYYNVVSDPTTPDSDGDFVLDVDELKIGTKTLFPDSDGDHLDDGLELDIGTNPQVTDSDGDETFAPYQPYADYLEYIGRPYDPLEASQVVQPTIPALEQIQTYLDYLDIAKNPTSPDALDRLVDDSIKLLSIVPESILAPHDAVEYKFQFIQATDPIVYEKHYTLDEAKNEFVNGAFCGDYKKEFAGPGDHENDYYAGGQLFSNLLWLGSVRDAGAAINHGDPVSFVINGIIGGAMGGAETKLGLKAGSVGLKAASKTIGKMGEKEAAKVSEEIMDGAIKEGIKDYEKVSSGQPTKEYMEALTREAVEDIVGKEVRDALVESGGHYTDKEIYILARGGAPLSAIAKAHTFTAIIDNCQDFKKQMLFVYGSGAKFTDEELKIFTPEDLQILDGLNEYRKPFSANDFSSYKDSVTRTINAFDSHYSRPLDPGGIVYKDWVEPKLNDIRGSYGEFLAYTKKFDEIKATGGNVKEFLYPLKSFNAPGPDTLMLIEYMAADGSKYYRISTIEAKNVLKLSPNDLGNYFRFGGTINGYKAADKFYAEYLFEKTQIKIEKSLTNLYKSQGVANAAKIAKENSFKMTRDYFRQTGGVMDFDLMITGKESQNVLGMINNNFPNKVLNYDFTITMPDNTKETFSGIANIVIKAL